ncbi:MAG: hypothetical protein KDC35_12855 [Acidobacteria bacterium]|nr:hypothetical protein [Acidobacteriota bacterium]
MELKDYQDGIEKLNSALRGLALGAGDIVSRMVAIRKHELTQIWQHNMPGDMWFDVKRMMQRIDAPDFTVEEAVTLADSLFKMKARLKDECAVTPQHIWV